MEEGQRTITRGKVLLENHSVDITRLLQRNGGKSYVVLENST
jgi:hypothetical protein